MFPILELIKNGEYMEAVLSILSRCFVVFCCMPIHELAHGWVAYKLGDNTAKLQGRLTFNPLKHLNPIGTLMIFLFGIGYANPVPINANNFKNPKQGVALTALAGPLSNLLMSFVSMFCCCALLSVISSPTGIGYAIAQFFYFAASVNVTLAVFNLLPIPPLDGSKILAVALPYKAYYKYMQYERYIMIALMILLFFGVLDAPILFLSKRMMNLISFLPKLIFHLR